MVQDLEHHFAPQVHQSYDLFFLTEILFSLTVRGFQRAVLTAQHASVYRRSRLRAAERYFCGVRDEATVESVLKFHPIILDFDL